jgi:hypothetical protein
MSSLNVEPHLVIEHTPKMEGEPDSDTEWIEVRDYHIAADNEGANNMYVGSQITGLVDYMISHPKRWWRIRYYETTQLSTTAGTMVMPGKSMVVTDNNRYGVHQEEFRDRNSDGYCELNQGLPVYEHCPRFYTEHDQADAPESKEKSHSGELKVGDWVRVADPAYCNDAGDPEGYVDPMFFGEVCKVITPKDKQGNVRVEHQSTGETNVILPEYLTKVKRDGSPIEEDDEEFKAGDEVEGEEDEAEKVYLKDGDTITVYDEYGHEKTLQIVVT